MDRKHIDLPDLLSVRFSYSPDADLRAFTDWAERRVSENEGNDSLLILASLGLDKDLSGYEVYHYFDVYLSDNAISHPTSVELLAFSVRYWLKSIAFSASENGLWAGLTRFNYYNNDASGLLKNIIDYWSDAHDDFINFCDEDEDYFFLSRASHKFIVKASRPIYVRQTALRFIRLFDSDYYFRKMCQKH